MLGEAISRRGFLAATAGVTLYGQSAKHVPIGLLIYAVLADWKKDFDGTLKAVANMGYEGVELTQYESWSPARGRDVRALLDSIKLKVFATHTEPEFFVPGDKMKAMIELNQVLGTQTVCCVRGLGTSATGIGYHAKASAENDAWAELADVLQSAS